jgi:signal peptidase I
VNCRNEFTSDQVARSPVRAFPSREIGLLQWGLARLLGRVQAGAPAGIITGGGNRILVNKFVYDYQPPQRWDVVVFKFPEASAVCRNSSCRYEFVLPRRETPRRCPMCGGQDLDARPDRSDHHPLDSVLCRTCGWKERTRNPAVRVRCPLCRSDAAVDTKNFIKRLVALPGEAVRVRHGDVFIGGRIARKTPEAQAAMWRFVYDSALPSRLPGRSPLQAWNARHAMLDAEGAGFRLTPAGPTPAWADFARPITDLQEYNGEGRDSHPVGDVRMEADLDLEPASAIATIRIAVDLPAETETREPGPGRVFDLRIESRLDASGRPDRWARVLANGRDLASAVRLPRANPLRLAFWHADAAVGLAIDGRPLLAREFDIAPEDLPRDGVSSQVSLAAEGAPLKVRRLRLWRDTYYRHGLGDAGFVSSERDVAISRYGYYMLGDNSASSRDSRMWGEVPLDFIIGKAFVVWYPFDDIREVW